MNSNRVLLSDKHGHALTLTEQEIGIALHALDVLCAAFDEEPEYAELIERLHEKLNGELTKEALEQGS